MADPLTTLTEAAVSIWLDDLSRGAYAHSTLAPDVLDELVVHDNMS
jgi:hypothetical protein